MKLSDYFRKNVSPLLKRPFNWNLLYAFLIPFCSMLMVMIVGRYEPFGDGRALLYSDEYRLTVRPHPEYVKRYGARMQAITEKYAHLVGEGLEFELDFTANRSVYSADMLITDWSGIALEYCFATRRPAVFVNTKLKCMNPNWEKIDCVPTEIALRDIVGVSVDKDKLDTAKDIVEELFAKADEYDEKIRKVLSEHIYNQGRAGEVGAKYLLESLVEKRKRS